MSIVVIIVGVIVVLGFAVLAFRGGSSSSASPAGGRPLPRTPSNPAGNAPATGNGKNWLVGIGGEVAGKTYLVGQRMCTIGRTPQNAIQITDSAASRTHCQIRPMGGFLQVTDMKSKNATYLNGTPVRGTARMNAGDELRIGEARFVYKIDLEGAKDAVLSGKEANSAVLRSTVPQAPKDTEKLLADVVVRALAEAQGDVDLAAKKLGVTPDTLRKVVEETRGRT